MGAKISTFHALRQLRTIHEEALRDQANGLPHLSEQRQNAIMSQATLSRDLRFLIDSNRWALQLPIDLIAADDDDDANNQNNTESNDDDRPDVNLANNAADEQQQDDEQPFISADECDN